MIILFEDYIDDVLSVFYRESCSKDMIKKLDYAGGNGNIPDKIKKYYECNTSDTRMIVLLDMVPDNPELIRIYKDISKEIKDTRVILLPTVCAEYYFIKMIVDYNIIPEFNNDIVINTCVNKLWYKDLQIPGYNMQFSKSFEDFCKYILNKYLPYCMSTKPSIFDNKTRINHKNPLYLYFYTKDCTDCNECCYTNTIKEKSLMYRKSFPIFTNLTLFDVLSLDENKLIDMHTNLVNEYNDWVDEYNKHIICGNDKSKFKKIVNIYREV